MAASSATWEKVIPRLCESNAVFAPDLLGHGESAKPPGDYSLGAYANLLRDLLETQGVHRSTLVGHSLGGGVAMQFAYQFPERCERLVLVATGGIGPDVHPILRAAALPGAELVLPWLSAAAACGISALVKATGRLGFRSSPDLDETWRSFVSLGDPESRRAFLHTVRGIIDLKGQQVIAIDRLYLTAGIPTLIVWGERDPLIPVRHAHLAHRAIAQSQLEIFSSSGHFPFLDDPDRFCTALLSFLRTTTPSPVDPSLLRSRLRSGPPPQVDAADLPSASGEWTQGAASQKD